MKQQLKDKSISETYTGLNIQWPISKLILSGEKTIETRTYPLPEKHLNKILVLVETPGKNGGFVARTIALIQITGCFKYNSKKEFYADYKYHKVSTDSPWAWSNIKPKWAWQVKVVKKLNPKIVSQKGIVFRKNISI